MHAHSLTRTTDAGTSENFLYPCFLQYIAYFTCEEQAIHVYEGQLPRLPGDNYPTSKDQY